MARKRKGNPVHGWLILDKPLNMTSTSAVNQVRRLLNAQKAGHGGTLDPLATGILPIALGEATKTVSYAQDGIKNYHFTVKWGEATSTDDAEGDVIKQSDHRPTITDIEKILPHYLGHIKQVPPKFSAIKINGERAYDLARSGQDVEIPIREVHIHEISLLEHDNDSAKFSVTCGKGTYVRSLARDMALELGTFGHVIYLRRTFVGNLNEEMSISLDELEKIVQDTNADEFLLPVEVVLDDIPALSLTIAETARLKNGQVIRFLSRQDVSRLTDLNIDITDGNLPALAVCDNKPIALIEINGTNIKPVRVLNL